MVHEIRQLFFCVTFKFMLFTALLASETAQLAHLLYPPLLLHMYCIYMTTVHAIFPHLMRIVSWKGPFTWSTLQASTSRERVAYPTEVSFSKAEPWMKMEQVGEEDGRQIQRDFWRPEQFKLGVLFLLLDHQNEFPQSGKWPRCH